MLELVRASLTGSIMGIILLVLGLSVLVGGLRHGIQKFDRSHAGTNATMLTLAVAALVIPSIFSHSIEMVNHDAMECLSLGVAGVMIVLYVLSLIYQLRDPKAHTYEDDEYAAAQMDAPHWVGFARWRIALIGGGYAASDLCDHRVGLFLAADVRAGERGKSVREARG
jgi:Ca2+:H+ antiporter